MNILLQSCIVVGESRLDMGYARPVVAYLRVSTERQELESQWASIEAWANSKGVVIDERIVEEEPASGAED